MVTFLDAEEVERVLPVQPGRGNRGVRQPVERDVVQDLVPGQVADRVPRDGVGDVGVAGRVVVEHPGGQPDGRVRDPVERLRLGDHFDPVAEALRVEEVQLLVGALLLSGQARRRRAAGPQDVTREYRGDIGRDDAGHVGVHADQLRRGVDGHHVGDDRAPVAALGHEPGVAQAPHQLGPGPGDAVRAPAGLPRLAGVPVARYRRDHHVEGVRCAAAVGGGVGERVDDRQQLDDRAGPPVGDDDRQRVLVFRADVDEVDVQPVDLGHEVRQGVQLRLAPAPVVLRRPVAREFVHHRQLHALRMIRDELLVGPAGGRDARTQRLQFRLGGDRDRERPDRRGTC